MIWSVKFLPDAEKDYSSLDGSQKDIKNEIQQKTKSHI